MSLGVTSWLQDTFSAGSDDDPDQLIKSRSLNTTRIGSVVLPVLTGVWTAISEFTDKPPFNEASFQKALIIVMVAFVGVVVSVDMLARAWVSAQQRAGSALVILPKALSCKSTDGKDTPGRAIGVRVDGDATSYLFVATTGGTSTWIAEDKLAFS
jgi:hypothetical protein